MQTQKKEKIRKFVKETEVVVGGIICTTETRLLPHGEDEQARDRWLLKLNG